MTVQLCIFNTGYCYHPEAVVIRDGGWRPVRFPATFACIEHPALGIVLFDTGYARRFFEATRRFPFRLYRWVTPVHTRPEESAEAQLGKRGIPPEAVRYIFISHFHADHIGGLKDFPNARFFCGRAGMDALFPLGNWQATQAGFLRALLPVDFTERCLYLESYADKPLPDAYFPFVSGADLAGDGSLMAVPLPGHHPGHYGLMCRTESGPVFLVGDACWHQRSYRRNIGPHPVTSLILEDFRGFNGTIGKLAELHQRNPELRIIPTHCPETHAR